MSAEMLNATLVVTALVITAIYQTSTSPPGGVWQADNTSSSASDPLFPTSNNVTLHFVEEKSEDKFISKHLMGEESRKAGTTILTPFGYFDFWLLNSLTFVLSIFLTKIILSNVPPFLLAPLFFLGISYFLSMAILAPSAILSKVNTFYMGCFVLVPYLVMLAGALRVSKSTNYKELINLRKARRGGRNVGIAERFNWLLSFM
ncbi:E3 ubiquitin-protein ligase HACE1-like [Gossypium australe]|uniref:E3 ubiquitin-protein ligase HACE1-like n=1 Tax=Gossypium australe TaxID=47621 RepID=A0A5B6U7Z5_9ROSI|nr:E3 ubiquitin-protein ligase HACE1-like [Gossypium australe]